MASKLPTVAIIGHANVGKSALFNRITKDRHSIVAREAGTTRDSVARKVATDSHQFWLIDTAGLKVAEDEFEATIQEQINEASQAADAIIVVVDGTKYPGQLDQDVARKALKSKKPVVLAINMSDKSSFLPLEEFQKLAIKTIVKTSAEHNRGIEELVDKVCQFLPAKQENDPESPLKIALIGRPNVGKSHLFNTLAGKQQAIVADVIGTTRDINRTTVNYHKQPIELLDTAGIRRQGRQEQGIEKFSVMRSMQAIDEADVCLLLIDAGDINVKLDQRLAGLIDEAGKGLILVVSKWDTVIDKEDKSSDHLLAKIAYNFEFVPWAPVILTSAVTGQNVAKIYDLALDIANRRIQETTTRKLNDTLQKAIQKHPPAGLKNTHPKLRYIVQTDTNPPWFVIHGSNLKFVHWSYKRYLERQIREVYNYSGTPIKFSFIDEKQVKQNRELNLK